MKGVVFTNFFDLVESRFSANMVDDIIDDAKPANGGAYTVIGTYPHEEMVALVVALSQRTGISVPDLLKVYGEYLFSIFVSNYHSFFLGINDAFDFLFGIEDVIHAEVRKLYPEAELPKFDTIKSHDGKELTLIYDSKRHFEDLAEGLLIGCVTHFGGNISIRREALTDGDTRKERFILARL